MQWCSIESRDTQVYATKGYYDHASQRQGDKSLIEPQKKYKSVGQQGCESICSKRQHGKLEHSHLKRSQQITSRNLDELNNQQDIKAHAPKSQ